MANVLYAALIWACTTDIFASIIYDKTMVSTRRYPLHRAEFATEFKKWPTLIQSDEITSYNLKHGIDDFSLVFSENDGEEVIGFDILISGSSHEFVDFVIDLNKRSGLQVENIRTGDTRSVIISLRLPEPIIMKSGMRERILRLKTMEIKIDYNELYRAPWKTAELQLEFAETPDSAKYQLAFELF